MSWSPEDDLDECGRTPREARNAGRCQCAGAGEWPGTCPGPAFCPLCQPDAPTCEECGSALNDAGECAPCLTARQEGEAFVAAHGLPDLGRA